MSSPRKKFYLGIDIGGTKILLAVCSSSGKLFHRRKVATPPKAGAPVIYQRLKDEIKALFKQENLSRQIFQGIGVGVPGVVTPDQRILVTPNIKLAGFPLAQQMHRDFKTRVVLGNDVNCGLLGEQWLGAGRGVKNILGIFPGTGVGGAIMVDGRLYIGTQGAAAEFGHMIIDYNSPFSSAGVTGSLEALTSRLAIERRIREAVKAGHKTAVTKLTGGKLNQIKSKVIKEALRKKDAVVMEILDEVAEILGKACISLRHVFNPEMIVFGGGVIEACGKYLLPKIVKVSSSDKFFKNVDNCAVVSSQLGDDAVILGAVALVKQEGLA